MKVIRAATEGVERGKSKPKKLILLVFLLTTLAACGSSPTHLPSPTPLPPQPTSASNVIRLANGSWEPFNGPDLPHAGCDSWVIQEAFALAGFDVEYSFFPWARSYSLSASGEWDGTLNWADTPEHRAQHYLSAEPTSIQEWVFFYRIDRPLVWKTMDDLKGKTIGTTAGFVYSDIFKDLRLSGDATFVESSSDDANFKMLLAGRIDVFLSERQVGTYRIKSIFTPEQQAQLVGSPQSFSQYESYLLLSKAKPENEQRMILFNQGFKELQANGRYAEIMKSCTP